MFKFKRAVATAIDTAVYAVLYFLLLQYIIIFDYYLFKSLYEKNMQIMIWMPWILNSFLPLILMYLLEVILGFSIGKLLLRLRIKGDGSDRPHHGKLFIRYMIKAILISTVLGAVFSLVSYITEGYVWYDNLLGLDVVAHNNRRKEFYNMFRR